MFYVIVLFIWSICSIINYNILNSGVLSRGKELNSSKKFVNLILGIGVGPVGTIWFLLFARLFLKIVYGLAKVLIMSDEFLEAKGWQPGALNIIKSILNSCPTNLAPMKSKEEEKYLITIANTINDMSKQFQQIDLNILTSEQYVGIIRTLNDFIKELNFGLEKFPHQKIALDESIKDIKNAIDTIESLNIKRD